MTTAHLYTLPELQAKHHIEIRHVRHVARLALELFDETHAVVGISRRYRRLLEAAALLHDIGFAADPSRHAEAGAELVCNTNLAGFTATEHRLLAAVILLHSRRYKDKIYPALFHSAPNKKLVLSLAAYLRVADALDSAHIQNTSIAELVIKNMAIIISVKCNSQLAIIDRAREKADLWHEVFRHEIRFKLADKKPLDYTTLLADVKTIAKSAFRLLYFEYQKIESAAVRTLEIGDTEAIHDLRIAIRRMHFLLKIFAKALPLPYAKKLARKLDAFDALANPLRDIDVFLAKLAEIKTNPPAQNKTSARARLISFLDAHRAAQFAKIKQFLKSSAYRQLCIEITRFIRIDVANVKNGVKKKNLARFTQRLLRRMLKKTAKHLHAIPYENPEALHICRKAVRRTRYLAEFFAAPLGQPASRHIALLKKMSQQLGAIHDIDMHIDYLNNCAPVKCPALGTYLIAQRKKMITAFHRLLPRFWKMRKILAARQ